MKTRLKIPFALMAACIVSLASCATTTFVRFNVNVPDATVVIDGRQITDAGQGTKLSNAIWDNPAVLVTAPGQRDFRGTLTRELKVGNALVGWLLFWPSFLWCYGPAPEQYFYLTPVQ